jgi:RHS repeat-associated protein
LQDSYDASGNLLQEPFLPGISDTYTYGADGIMTSSNGTTYTYDGLGQRVRKDSSGGAKEYFYFGGTLLSTRDAATGAWTDNIYGGGRFLATVAGTETATPVWRMGDHLDSLAYQADNQGNLLSTTSMTPFGQLLADGSGSSYLFTGLERDSENNTDHTPNRQYNSRQGRWLSPDPYLRSIDLTNPQSLNRYSYVLNNPLRFVDPSGLDCVTAGFTKEGLPVITINQGDCPGKDPNNEYYMDCDSRGGDGCLMGSTSAQTNGDGNLVLFDSNGHEMGQVGADSTGGFGYTGSQSQSDGFPTIFAMQSDTGSMTLGE